MADLPSPNVTYVFLGNYTGEGFASQETLFMLLAFKLLYPNNVYLLRGNNEDTEVLKVRFASLQKARPMLSRRLTSFRKALNGAA